MRNKVLSKKAQILLGIVCIAFIMIAVIAGRAIVQQLRGNLEGDLAELGVRAVRCMYEFGSAEQLDSNMLDLKLLTTNDVFAYLTIDNEERTLCTYLKFKNEPVSVNVIKSTSSYVLYSLDTEAISEDRIFLFLFDVDSSGKISGVREVEGIDFVDRLIESD